MTKKKNVNDLSGWYHNASTNDFGAIAYLSDEEAHLQESYPWGPYKTFAAAKKNAIGYYECDIRLAEEQIETIRAIKNPRKP